MTPREARYVRNATLYDLRLIIDQDDKENYTKAEILKLIDTLAVVKDQEN